MRLGRSGIEAIPVRFLGHAVLLAFLLFDVLANGFNGHAPSGPAIVRVRPQRGQFLFEKGKLLPELVRRRPLDELHQPMNAKLRITSDQQMHMIRHDLTFYKFLSPFLHDFLDERLEARLDAIDQHLASILGAKDHVIVATIDNILVALNYCIHTSSIAQNNRLCKG